MKKLFLVVISIVLIGSLFAQEQGDYITNRVSGTIMIGGSGFYRTDLSADLPASLLRINGDLSLFLFPQLAVGVDLGWERLLNTEEAPVIPHKTIETILTSLYLGPRGYLFLGTSRSQLTPFLKGGVNFLTNKKLVDGNEEKVDKRNLGITASAGLLLNLVKNVGFTVEAEYNFEKGQAGAVDLNRLFIKFGIRSFLSE